MTELQKLPQESKDMTADNIEKLATIFPNCITEVKDKDGIIKKSVNFDVLKQMMSSDLIEGSERYEFTWPGKNAAILEANTPIRKTLRPCVEESKDWENTQNLYIEGDNLNALKLLQESYLGKVKMIYIDPPYNTGNDFIYKDKFAQSENEYDEESGAIDEDGNRMFKNTDSNGRFHSDWCSMIYPRLLLARSLLSSDGVIFISIDDNEQSNLNNLCNEIFGQYNFIAQITREAIKGGSQSKNIRITHDYLLVYAKDINSVEFGGIEVEGIKLNLKDEKGAYAKGRELNKWGAGSRREDSPSMWFPIPGPNGEEVYPIRNDGSEGRWRLGKEKMRKIVAEGDVIFEKRENGTYIVYEKIRDGSSRTKQFISILKDDYINAKGTEDIKKLFNIERSYFDYAKPTNLIKDLLIMSNVQDEDIVLDFFSGSATSAHAVMQLNSEDGKNRKFIMVQLPELTDEKSEAFKAGIKNICELGEERIKKAGEKIKLDSPNITIDTGFRVLKIADSNMKDVYYNPDALSQDLLSSLESNIKEDRSDLDLLFGCLLDFGLTLDKKIKEEVIDRKKILIYNDDAEEGADLIACFEDNISEDLIKEIAKRKPSKAVFKDSSFANSPVKINLFEIFKLYAEIDANELPSRVKVI